MNPTDGLLASGRKHGKKYVTGRLQRAGELMGDARALASPNLRAHWSSRQTHLRVLRADRCLFRSELLDVRASKWCTVKRPDGRAGAATFYRTRIEQ